MIPGFLKKSIQHVAFMRLEGSKKQDVASLTSHYLGETLDNTTKKLLDENLSIQTNEENFFRTIFLLISLVAALELTGITHRDLKMDNILVRPKYHQYGINLVLIDFGMVNEVEGTKAYRAPECFENSPYHKKHGKSANVKMDVWAVGILIWELLAMYSKDENPRLPNAREKYRKNWGGMMDKSVTQNLAHMEFTDHRLRKFVEMLLDTMLEWDPANRPGAIDLLHEFFVGLPATDPIFIYFRNLMKSIFPEMLLWVDHARGILKQRQEPRSTSFSSTTTRVQNKSGGNTVTHIFQAPKQESSSSVGSSFLPPISPLVPIKQSTSGLGNDRITITEAYI